MEKEPRFTKSKPGFLKWKMRFTRKLASQKGETMAESLLSLLLIALSVSMLLNAVILSGRIIDKAREKERRTHTAMAFLERLEEDWGEEGLVEKRDLGTLNISIKTEKGKLTAKEEFPVNVYDSPYGAVYRWEE